MATLKQYFETDLNRLYRYNQSITFRVDGEDIEVICQINYDFDADVYFISYYVPQCKNAFTLNMGLVHDLRWVERMTKEIVVTSGAVYEKDEVVSTELKFSGRIFIYCATDLRLEEISEIKSASKKVGYAVQYRGQSYAAERSKLETPLAFLSHDTRDKDEIVRPLAIRLTSMMCPVWYDEYSLKPGISLRQSIETGLKECRKCILVLTPNFLANTGWTKTEFNSIFTREIMERNNVVIPIWHGVTAREVYEYSPSLADRVAIHWSKGLDEVSRLLYNSITT